MSGHEFTPDKLETSKHQVTVKMSQSSNWDEIWGIYKGAVVGTFAIGAIYGAISWKVPTDMDEAEAYLDGMNAAATHGLLCAGYVATLPVSPIIYNLWRKQAKCPHCQSRRL